MLMLKPLTHVASGLDYVILALNYPIQTLHWNSKEHLVRLLNGQVMRCLGFDEEG